MENLIRIIGIIVLALILIAIGALLGGTIVWLIWPIAIPAVFPGLVAAGTIAAKITWWQSVCFVWLCGLLIKSTTNYDNKK